MLCIKTVVEFFQISYTTCNVVWFIVVVVVVVVVVAVVVVVLFCFVFAYASTQTVKGL